MTLPTNPNTPSDAAKEGEPVRRWTLWIADPAYGWHVHRGEHFTEKMGATLVEVMPVADHEAALLAARQVDEAASWPGWSRLVERAAEAHWESMRIRRPWLVAWEKLHTSDRICHLRDARAALLAALNEPSEAVSPRKILKTVLGPIKVIPECKAQAVCVNGLKCWEAGRCLKPEGWGNAEPEERWSTCQRVGCGHVPERHMADGRCTRCLCREYLPWLDPEPADLNPTEKVQAEIIHSLAIRFTEQEAELHRLREAAEAVERARRSFHSSLPYQPPEALWDLFREKLAAPLDRLRAVLNPESEAER